MSDDNTVASKHSAGQTFRNKRKNWKGKFELIFPFLSLSLFNIWH